MSNKALVFKPELYTPVGMNNYSGELFRCFTKGDTLPFKFTFPAGYDITDCQVWVVFSDVKAESPATELTQNLLEVQIPITDLPGGVFSGEVSDSETHGLPAGITYGQIKFISASGQTRIMDMCTLEVYPTLTFTTL